MTKEKSPSVKEWIKEAEFHAASNQQVSMERAQAEALIAIAKTLAHMAGLVKED